MATPLPPNLKVCPVLRQSGPDTDPTLEVDRAMDNLVKSGKFYAGGPRPMGAMRPGSDYGK